MPYRDNNDQGYTTKQAYLDAVVAAANDGHEETPSPPGSPMDPDEMALEIRNRKLRVRLGAANEQRVDLASQLPISDVVLNPEGKRVLSMNDIRRIRRLKTTLRNSRAGAVTGLHRCWAGLLRGSHSPLDMIADAPLPFYVSSDRDREIRVVPAGSINIPGRLNADNIPAPTVRFFHVASHGNYLPEDTTHHIVYLGHYPEVEESISGPKMEVIPERMVDLMERLVPGLEFTPVTEVVRGEASISDDKLCGYENAFSELVYRLTSPEATRRGIFMPRTTDTAYHIEITVFNARVEVRLKMGDRLLNRYRRWFQLVETGQAQISAEPLLREFPGVVYDLRDYWLSERYGTDCAGPCYLGMRSGITPNNTLDLHPRASPYPLLFNKVISSDGTIKWVRGGRVSTTESGAVRHMGLELGDDRRWLRLEDLDGRTLYNGVMDARSVVTM